MNRIASFEKIEIMENINANARHNIPSNSRLSPGYAYRAIALRPNLSPASWDVLEHVATLKTAAGVVHVSPDSALAPLWPTEQRAKNPLNFENYQVGFQWHMLAQEGGVVVVTRTEHGFSYEYINKDDRLSELRAILALSVPIDDPRVTVPNERFKTEHSNLYQEMVNHGWILAQVRPSTIDIVSKTVGQNYDSEGLAAFIEKLYQALKNTFPNNKISFLQLSVGHGTHGTNIRGGHDLSHEYMALARKVEYKE